MGKVWKGGVCGEEWEVRQGKWEALISTEPIELVKLGPS